MTLPLGPALSRRELRGLFRASGTHAQVVPVPRPSRGALAVPDVRDGIMDTERRLVPLPTLLPGTFDPIGSLQS